MLLEKTDLTNNQSTYILGYHKHNFISVGHR